MTHPLGHSVHLPAPVEQFLHAPQKIAARRLEVGEIPPRGLDLPPLSDESGRLILERLGDLPKLRQPPLDPGQLPVSPGKLVRPRIEPVHERQHLIHPVGKTVEPQFSFFEAAGLGEDFPVNPLEIFDPAERVTRQRLGVDDNGHPGFHIPRHRLKAHDAGLGRRQELGFLVEPADLHLQIPHHGVDAPRLLGDLLDRLAMARENFDFREHVLRQIIQLLEPSARRLGQLPFANDGFETRFGLTDPGQESIHRDLDLAHSLIHRGHPLKGAFCRADPSLEPLGCVDQALDPPLEPVEEVDPVEELPRFRFNALRELAQPRGLLADRDEEVTHLRALPFEEIQDLGGREGLS